MVDEGIVVVSIEGIGVEGLLMRVLRELVSIVDESIVDKFVEKTTIPSILSSTIPQQQYPHQQCSH